MSRGLCLAMLFLHIHISTTTPAMNIAMFCNTYLPMLGGIENSIATFAEDYRRAGQGCLVITPEMNEARESTPEVMRVPAIKNVGGSAFSLHLPVPGLISARMNEFAPDIMHAHHPFLMGDSALRNARRLNVPLVLTYHTQWDRYSNFFPNEITKNIVVRLSVEYANLCDCVVAPTASMERLLRGMGVEAPIEVIPTGIDLELFKMGSRTRGRERLGIVQDAHVFGYVGRIGPEKNLAWLARAAISFCKEDSKGMFVLVGKGAFSDTLRRMFEEAGMAGRIIVAGPFAGVELADAYKALDLFSFVSLSDTQGIVLAEAMASGLPIVALDAPGSREAASNAVNGVLLPASSGEQDYAAALSGLFADSERLAAMGRESAVRSLDYDRARSASRMLSLYGRLIEQRRAAPDYEGGELGVLERLKGRLEAEWELISTKASATFDAISKEKPE